MSMPIEVLRKRLAEIDGIANEEWMRSLPARSIAELEFHNRDRGQERKQQAREQDTFEKFYGNAKYYGTTRRSREYLTSWIKSHAPDAVFLDYACGHAGSARLAARCGAALAIGIDISDVSVVNARGFAEAEGLSGNTYFVQANAEDTRLPDNSVDAVMCSGMLHHLDLSYAFPELRRILKPGGRVLAVESLDYNPAIKLYRSLTPDMRTEWEKAHILSLSDLEFARRFFDVEDVRFWHVVGYAGAKVRPLAPFLDWLDDQILERVPLLRLMAWQWTFELVKR
jgi:ubiquinone/menaquinone biosynthesis C-methylase UbiE